MLLFNLVIIRIQSGIPQMKFLARKRGSLTDSEYSYFQIIQIKPSVTRISVARVNLAAFVRILPYFSRVWFLFIFLRCSRAQKAIRVTGCEISTIIFFSSHPPTNFIPFSCSSFLLPSFFFFVFFYPPRRLLDFCGTVKNSNNKNNE